MSFFYSPVDPRCKSLTGACRRGSTVTFRIFETSDGEGNFSAGACSLVFYQDGQPETVFPMAKTADGFELALTFSERGLYFYYFAFPDNVFLGRGKLRRGVVTNHPESWQITVYDEDYQTPDFLKGGILYQIFPDRFFRAGNGTVRPRQRLRTDWGGYPSYLADEDGKVRNCDFFGGDLRGVTAKLGYLKGLGVSAIYFNPIFEAYSNHRYDTGDYLKIDSLLGTEEDFDELVAKAKALGISVILDGVFNHTGDDSRYFNKYGTYPTVGAYQSPDSPYAAWYRFRAFPDDYESWWGIKTLPDLDENNESYQNFICGDGGVLDRWLSHGVKGYRLDVADELPDAFIRKIRASVKRRDPDAILIGEVWEDASNKISYDERRQYLLGDELDSVMNYPLKDGILDFMLSGNCEQLRETVFMLLDNYPKETLDVLMNVLGTHDTPRIITALGGKHCRTKAEMAKTTLSQEERARAKKLVKMAALLEYTLFGVPCIYYGDEAGMEGYGDPFCRGCFPWDDADEELTAYFRTLGTLRRETFADILKDGGYREIFAERSCFIYERRKGGRALYVFCNRSPRPYRLNFEGEMREYLTGKRCKNTFVIPPDSCGILARP